MTAQDLRRLSEPFAPEDIEWRVQSAGVSESGTTWARVLAYVTSRAIMERLDSVCGPENWQNDFKLLGNTLAAGIGVRIGDVWVWKWDGAGHLEATAGLSETDAGKGDYSNAMKRAGYQWGIGRYLYELEEGFAVISEKGSLYGRTPKDKGNRAFRWDPPKLPGWALPGGSGRPDDGANRETPVRKLAGEEPKGQVPASKRVPNGKPASGAPACPKCAGPVWDNRTNKKNPKAPDWSCKDKDKCKWALWLDSAIGELQKEAERLAEAGVISVGSIAPLLEGVAGGDLDALRIAQDWLNTKAAEAHGNKIRADEEADNPFAEVG